MRLLLIFCPDPDHRNNVGDSAIIVASRQKNADIVRLLIVDGYDINCCNMVGPFFVDHRYVCHD